MRLPFGVDVHHVRKEGIDNPMIDDDELQTNQKGEPILVQHDHGHHDEEMKVQLDSPSREMHEQSRGRHQSKGCNGGLKSTADDGKLCSDGDGSEEGSAAQIEAGTDTHIGAVEGNTKNVEPEDVQNTPMTDGPRRLVQHISLRQSG